MSRYTLLSAFLDVTLGLSGLAQEVGLPSRTTAQHHGSTSVGSSPTPTANANVQRLFKRDTGSVCGYVTANACVYPPGGIESCIADNITQPTFLLAMTASTVQATIMPGHAARFLPHIPRPWAGWKQPKRQESIVRSWDQQRATT